MVWLNGLTAPYAAELARVIAIAEVQSSLRRCMGLLGFPQVGFASGRTACEMTIVCVRFTKLGE